MDIQSMKITLVQKLLATSKESLLVKISEILDQEMVVGYTTDGKPLTLENYNKRLEVAEEQIKYGDTSTQEDIEKESKNW